MPGFAVSCICLYCVIRFNGFQCKRGSLIEVAIIDKGGQGLCPPGTVILDGGATCRGLEDKVLWH